MMKTRVLALPALLAAAFTASAQSGNVYLQTNLVSNSAGVAAVTDPNLVDPWGVSFSGGSPFWVSDHLTGLATLYNGAGAITAIVVTIPKGSASPATAIGRPTGQVFNGTATAFLIANGKAASFIFATEDGTISAWNGGTVAEVKVDNSGRNAVYKGLAIGTSAAGATLYAANFRSAKIDAFGPTWAPATLAGSFSDPAIPSGFAPFNIWNLNNNLYVTYARQDFNQYLDVAARGNGFVSVFDLNGNLITHLVSNGVLNSPWGVAIAPAGWGAFGGDVLVGNFGDGRINAFDPKTGALVGTLNDASGNPIGISGLWAIAFGNGGRGGDYNTLYFLAGVPSGSSAQRG
ncbi:MAG: TIGR03118 family protein, partial [Acidobacteriota bacterium]|nr:TIGR03118 family protein [Acidobacteriota bacterium]